MKKSTKLIIALCLLVAVVIGTVVGVQKYNEYYERTFIVIDDVEYRRDVTGMDLSNTQIGEFEKLFQLTRLKELDLRNTGITTASNSLP